MTATTHIRAGFRWALAIFLVALVPYVAWSAWDYHEANRLAGLLERARGLTGAELQTAPMGRGNTIDAVRLYFAAAMLSPLRPDPLPVDRTGAAGPDAAADMRAALATYAPAFDLVRRARTQPAHPWPVESAEWRGANLVPLLRLLSFRTRALAQLGEVDAATASLLDEVDLLRIVDARVPRSVPMPFFVGRSAVLAQVASDLPLLLAAGRVPSQAAESLAAALGTDPPDEQTLILSRQIQQILQSRALDSQSARQVRTLPADLGQLLARPAARSQASDLVAARLDAIDALGPTDDWAERLRRLEAAASAAGARDASLLGSTLVMADDAAARLAVVRAGRALLAVERYRAEHGTRPVGLGDLVPDELAEITMDPFDGKPLRYKADLGGAVVVYSVGRNRADDGGEVGRFSPPGSEDQRLSPDVGLRARLP